MAVVTSPPPPRITTHHLLLLLNSMSDLRRPAFLSLPFLTPLLPACTSEEVRIGQHNDALSQSIREKGTLAIAFRGVTRGYTRWTDVCTMDAEGGKNIGEEKSCYILVSLCLLIIAKCQLFEHWRNNKYISRYKSQDMKLFYLLRQMTIYILRICIKYITYILLIVSTVYKSFSSTVSKKP